MSAVLGRPIRYTQPGLLRYAINAHRQQMPAGMVAVTSVVYSTARLGLAAQLTHDVEQVLGRPPTTMTAFIHRERTAFRPTATS